VWAGSVFGNLEGFSSMIADVQFIQNYLSDLGAVMACGFGFAITFWLVMYAITEMIKWVSRHV
jgi:hypothetical protein